MKNWYYPKNLKQLENDQRKMGVSEVNPTTDFGSYKIMLETDDPEKSLIASHNDINPDQKIAMIKSDIIKSGVNGHEINRILNVGCGLGMETKSIAEIFNAETLGIDISTDAILYARKKYQDQKISFLDACVDENLELNVKYDICLAIEFYPFTRTNDIEFQINIIRSLFKNLSQNGTLVIHQTWDINDSLKENIHSICKTLNKKIFLSDFEHLGLYKKFGNNRLTNLAIKFLRFSSKLSGRDFFKPARTIIFY